MVQTVWHCPHREMESEPGVDYGIEVPNGACRTGEHEFHRVPAAGRSQSPRSFADPQRPSTKAGYTAVTNRTCSERETSISGGL